MGSSNSVENDVGVAEVWMGWHYRGRLISPPVATGGRPSTDDVAAAGDAAAATAGSSSSSSSNNRASAHRTAGTAPGGEGERRQRPAAATSPLRHKALTAVGPGQVRSIPDDVFLTMSLAIRVFAFLTDDRGGVHWYYRCTFSSSGRWNKCFKASWLLPRRFAVQLDNSLCRHALEYRGCVMHEGFFVSGPPPSPSPAPSSAAVKTEGGEQHDGGGVVWCGDDAVRSSSSSSSSSSAASAASWAQTLAAGRVGDFILFASHPNGELTDASKEAAVGVHACITFRVRLDDPPAKQPQQSGAGPIVLDITLRVISEMDRAGMPRQYVAVHWTPNASNAVEVATTDLPRTALDPGHLSVEASCSANGFRFAFFSATSAAASGDAAVAGAAIDED
jgi:hypothetical protein